MIEISHQQARRLVRESLDATSAARISEVQWVALESHLENCPACRSYAQKRRALPKDLGRSLHQRWMGVGGPNNALPDHVVKDFRRARRNRRLLFRSWAVGLAVVILAVLYFTRQFLFPDLFADQQASSATNAAAVLVETAAVTPEPSPTQPGTIDGVMVFESSHLGNSEIYLLNTSPARSDLTNLTQSPAQDTSPAWSPDGEWVAFLSDRSGKADIYVVSVAGTRLARLTADPTLRWRGPLSWSPDGRWIAARAERLDQGNETYVNMVPLDGRQELRSVALTRGVTRPALFSPSAAFLAFQPAYQPGWMYVYNYETGEYIAVNQIEVQNQGLRAFGPFDWVRGGQRLIYQAQGTYFDHPSPQLLDDPRSEIRMSFDLNGPAEYTLAYPTMWGGHTVEGLERYRAISEVPGSLLAATLLDLDGDGCWTLNLHHMDLPGARIVEVSGLCIEGQISRASWLAAEATLEEIWLVARARKPGEEEIGIYGLRVPTVFTQGTRSPLDAPVERFGLPGVPASDDPTWWPGDPQVRPGGQSLGIMPYEAKQAGQDLQKRLPDGSEAGRALEGQTQPVLVGVTRQADGAGLVSLRLSGAEVARTFNPDAGFACPVLSPDGLKVAFTALAAEGGRQARELFVASPAGGEMIQLTGPDAPGILPGNPSIGLPGHHCPVWSPDGARVAAIYSTTGVQFLVVAPVDGSSKPIYLQIEETVVTIDWQKDQDGSAPIYLLNSSYFSHPPRINMIDLESPENQSAARVRGAAVEETLLEFPGFDGAAGFAISPDGTRSAVLLLDFSSNGQVLVTRSVLSVGELDQPQAVVELGPTDVNEAFSRGLGWLRDGRLGLLHSLPLTGQEKTFLQLYDPQAENLVTVARLNDPVSDAVWDPDGEWVFLGGESGLFALNLPLALRGQAAPILLSLDWMSEVDFHRP